MISMDRVRDRKRDVTTTITSPARGQVSYFTVALDGTGDFTDVQSAINSLPATGGAIYVKNGTYIVNSTIAVNKANVTIFGSGNNTILKAKNSLNADMISVTKNYVELRNFQIDGNRANNTSGSGVNVNTEGYFTADGLEITSCTDYGICIYKTTDPPDFVVVSAYHNVNNCRIHDCKVPLWLKRIEHAIFTNLTCYNASQYAGYFHSPSLSKFINCIFSGTNQAGYSAVKFDGGGSVPGSNNIQVINCTFLNAKEGGIIIIQSSYFMIQGNNFTFVCSGANNTYNSIEGNYLSDSTITGNVFQEMLSVKSKNAFEEIGASSNYNIFYLNRIKNSTSNVTLLGASSIAGNNVTA